MRHHHHPSLRRNNHAVSPAFSSIILTAGVIVMILVALSYANNMLNTKMAQNEYETNKQFMQTTGQQIDDIAWTIGRTQTIDYSCKFGQVKYLEAALDYTFSVHTASGWRNLTLSGQTGILLYNMPTETYSLTNNYFQRIPQTANSSFVLFESSSPVTQVFCEEKLPMPDGGYLRVVLVPTMRVLTSTISNGQSQTSYYKFYLPQLISGHSPYFTQSVTLTGNGISKVTESSVDQVCISVSFPQNATGFDSSFFNFKTTSITLNSFSTPQMSANSVVEFYIGKVLVNIGGT